MLESDGARNDLDMVVQVAESYYLENKTQSDIAKELGISSSTISRLLSRARDEGIVRINIVRPQSRNVSLERILRQRFTLNEVIVAKLPVGADEEEGRRMMGVAAATAIDALIKPGMVIGVGRGRSLAALAVALQAQAVSRQNIIVQLLGEYDIQHSSSRSAEITRLLAEMYSGVSYYLNAPALVDDPALADRLLCTPGVSQVLPFYDHLDMALLGVGPLRGSPLEQNGLLREAQIAQLEAAGAVGDICGHFFNDEAKSVDSAYSGRSIGMNWEQLQRCPCIVAVAAGSNKIRALRALLNASTLQVLVTDEQTAQQIANIA